MALLQACEITKNKERCFLYFYFSADHYTVQVQCSWVAAQAPIADAEHWVPVLKELADEADWLGPWYLGMERTRFKCGQFIVGFWVLWTVPLVYEKHAGRSPWPSFHDTWGSSPLSIMAKVTYQVLCPYLWPLKVQRNHGGWWNVQFQKHNVLSLCQHKLILFII